MRVLVDTSNIYMRNKSKIGHLRTSDGRMSGALYGSFRLINAIEKRFKPDEIYMIFEGGGSQVRKEIYPAYKGDRVTGEMWEEGHRGALAKWSMLKGHIACQATGCEADDLIAHYCRVLPGPIVIASSDHDFFRLLGDDVSMMRKGTADPLYTLADFEAEFGTEPDEYLLICALAGDSSDNVAGIPGVGTVTAAKLLREAGSWSDVLQHPRVNGHRETVMLNMRVLQFREVNELEEMRGRPTDWEDELVNLYDEWEMASLVKELRGV